jgi:hypothetical protein
MEVRFGVDATSLTTYFGNEKFDRIQFNFPHWRGKANNKRNRYDIVNRMISRQSTSCISISIAWFWLLLTVVVIM